MPRRREAVRTAQRARRAAKAGARAAAAQLGRCSRMRDLCLSRGRLALPVGGLRARGRQLATRGLARLARLPLRARYALLRGRQPDLRRARPRSRPLRRRQARRPTRFCYILYPGARGSRRRQAEQRGAWRAQRPALLAAAPGCVRTVRSASVSLEAAMWSCAAGRTHSCRPVLPAAPSRPPGSARLPMHGVRFERARSAMAPAAPARPPRRAPARVRRRALPPQQRVTGWARRPGPPAAPRLQLRARDSLGLPRGLLGGHLGAQRGGQAAGGRQALVQARGLLARRARPLPRVRAAQLQAACDLALHARLRLPRRARPGQGRVAASFGRAAPRSLPAARAQRPGPAPAGARSPRLAA